MTPLSSFLLLLLSLITYTLAYITDIKLVACDTNHACANYPGYRKLPTNLNEGVKDASSIFLHIKEDHAQDPITDIAIIGYNATLPKQWTKLDVDLNQFSNQPEERETSLWLYYTKDKSISKNPVTSIIVKQGTSPMVGAEYKRIPVDLNKGVGGFHLFMYYSQDGPKGKSAIARNVEDCITKKCCQFRSYYCSYC
jgi:hypothetical protein